MALARRYGFPIVVWYESKKVWLRVCIAPAFSQGYAKLARNANPLVLVPRQEHYQWLQPPDKGTVPKAWLAESTLPKPSVLRGGGPKGEPSLLQSGTPSVHSLGSNATPSLRSLRTFMTSPGCPSRKCPKPVPQYRSGEKEAI